MTVVNLVHLYLATNDEIDTPRIAQFLRVQDGVVDANVWVQKGVVLARVTVAEDVYCEEGDLRTACEKRLGPNNTPSMIMLERTFRLAA